MSSRRQARMWVAVAVGAVGALTAASLRSAGSEPYSGKEWAAPGGDWASTRYSTLGQINTRNIDQLGGAWVVEAPDRAEATPMVKDGRMFVVTTAGVIMALDPATGATLWTFKPEMPFSGKRGIGIGDGLLFAALRNSNVMAISQETGTLVWTSEHPKDIPSQGMATAPAYGNGVVVGVVSLGDNFLHGRAIGYDAKTGKFLWNFDVVPGPGEPGHETWPQDSDVWKYGGGAIWTTPSVDEELGLVYLPTGNAVPQYGGELRPGNNLFDNSVVALDLKTGKMRWYFQAVHHDIWEADLSTPLVMYDTTFGGRSRKALAAMRTDGILFILDRETGKPLVPIEERPVRQDAFLKTWVPQILHSAAYRKDGVLVIAFSGDGIKASGPAVKTGALVQSVQKGTPAEHAGIRGGNVSGSTEGGQVAVGGDIIVSIDGKQVNSSEDLANDISAKKPGDKVTVGLERANGKGGYEHKTVSVTLASRPNSVPNPSTPEG